MRGELLFLGILCSIPVIVYLASMGLDVLSRELKMYLNRR